MNSALFWCQANWNSRWAFWLSFAVACSIANAVVFGADRESSVANGVGGTNRVNVDRCPIYEPAERNLRTLWRARAGSQIASLSVGGGRIFVATNNKNPRDNSIQEDNGVVMCFDTNGNFLWQSVHGRLPRRTFDLPGAPIHSRPILDGKRVYYISNRGELVCLDTDGFTDGKNDGPVMSEGRAERNDADVIWKIDLADRFGVMKRDASDVGTPNSVIAIAENLLFCVTQHGKHPTPQSHASSAASFLCLDKTSGAVQWISNLPSTNIVYGQWSSPVVWKALGGDTVMFPGGDGYLYAYYSRSNIIERAIDLRIITRSDEQQRAIADRYEPIPNWVPVASPTIVSNLLLIGCNWDFERPGKSPLAAFDLRDLNESRQPKWTFQDDDFESTFSSAIALDGIVFVLGWKGVLFALNVNDGTELWRSDLKNGRASIHGGVYTAAGKLYVVTESMLTVFSTGPRANCLGRYQFDGANPTQPVVVGGVIYVACEDYVYAIRDQY